MTQQAAPLNAPPMIQGVQTPNVVVDPQTFYAATQRQRFSMAASQDFNGLGSVDSVQLRQAGIVAALEVRIRGNVTFGGTIGTTTMDWSWPFDMCRFRLSANGQSNLLDVSGGKIRALEFCTNPKIVDNGVDQLVGGDTVDTGTLALACDDWGTGATTSEMGPGSNVTVAEAHTVDITYLLPVAGDPTLLIGAVYAQSSATNLTLDIQWATQAQLISALGGSATVDFDLEYDVTGVVYSIPIVGGRAVVPDLSMFHQLSEANQAGFGAGENEYEIPGTGTGRQLLRLLSNIWTGSGINKQPLPVLDANYNTIAWRYGGNITPETYSQGGKQRALNNRQTGVDIGRYWGLILQDWASEWALRDVIDLGQTTDFRVVLGLVSSPTSPSARIMQETVFAAPVGA